MPVASDYRAAIVASPKVKLRRKRIAIDHPDPKAGEMLLAEALGVTDGDALHGMLAERIAVVRGENHNA